MKTKEEIKKFKRILTFKQLQCEVKMWQDLQSPVILKNSFPKPSGYRNDVSMLNNNKLQIYIE
jgi:hypothetical protein